MAEIRKLIDNRQDSREDLLSKLFDNVDTETEMMVDLPSKGRFYKNFTGVTVKALKFEDEQKLLSNRSKNQDLVGQIIAKCSEGIDPAELLTMDKLYLLMKIREVSYGSEYKFEIPCPSCGEITAVDLDLANHLMVEYVPDDLQDPREVFLPVLKKKAVVRFPRAKDEPFMQDIDSAIKNQYRLIESIDGVNDPVFIAEALKRMHIRDVKTLSKESRRNDLGLDPRFSFECPHCKFNSLMEVPLNTANFFSMT